MDAVLRQALVEYGVDDKNSGVLADAFAGSPPVAFLEGLDLAAAILDGESDLEIPDILPIPWGVACPEMIGANGNGQHNVFESVIAVYDAIIQGALLTSVLLAQRIRYGRKTAVPPPPPQNLPVIYCSNRQLRDTASEAINALLVSNDPPRIFVRFGNLARVRRDERHKAILETLNEYHLRGYLTRAADFFRPTLRGQMAISPPMDIIADVLHIGEWAFPPLKGITNAPILRPDGALHVEAGYDDQTALYYHKDRNFFVDCPKIDSKSIEEAKWAIDDAIHDFPFVSECDRTHAVALMLTPLLRHFFDKTPLFLINKPQAGVGAGLLIEVITTIALGFPEAIQTAPPSEEEWRKEILTKLIQGSQINIFDNVEENLGSASLASILTTGMHRGRVLGQSKEVIVPNESTWIANGNNVKLSGDLPRRVVWIDMESTVSRPWMKKPEEFRHQRLLEHVEFQRGRILSSLFMLARAWFEAGKPKPSTPIIGSFERWSEIVGGILENAGYSNFLDNIYRKYDQEDEESRQWEGFLKVWMGMYGTDMKSAKEVAEDTEQPPGRLAKNEILFDSLPEELATAAVSGRGSYPRRMGKALAKRKGKRYGKENVTLRGEVEPHLNTIVWWVELVK